MKDRDYKEAWQTLKESKTQKYILTRNAYGTKHIAAIIHSIDLEKMDELDDTHEFRNLLDDMNREDK
ncbi:MULTISPECIES: hypothetical protein [unclassified Mammaliicoccus]|uniref:hypothetical protein n=1 Tax=unclassified Mammaliicoccus TaxID=2803851 RepID=UPI001EFA7726|nr:MULTISPECIES: hypothetical protein [unclassified Mammaliicoccus]